MPVIFDEISGEVAPERSGTAPEVPQQPATEGTDPAELMRRQLQLLFEREQRLRAD
jgi:hypothetical protein